MPLRRQPVAKTVKKRSRRAQALDERLPEKYRVTETFFFNKATNSFRVGRQICRGVTKHIARRFFPFGEQTIEKIIAAAPGGSGGGGLEHGKRIHKEIETFLATSPRPALDTLSKEASDVIRLLRANGLEPVAAEVPAFWEDRGYATPVDIVCERSSDGGIVLIELKTGFTYSWNSSLQTLKAPFQAQVMSPCNAAHLQLAATWVLWQKCRSVETHPVCAAYVCLVNKSNAKLFPLESWAREGMRAIEETMQHRKSKRS